MPAALSLEVSGKAACAVGTQCVFAETSEWAWGRCRQVNTTRAHKSGLRPGREQVRGAKRTPAEGTLAAGLWRGFLSWDPELEPEG